MKLPAPRAGLREVEGLRRCRAVNGQRGGRAAGGQVDALDAGVEDGTGAGLADGGRAGRDGDGGVRAGSVVDDVAERRIAVDIDSVREWIIAGDVDRVIVAQVTEHQLCVGNSELADVARTGR